MRQILAGALAGAMALAGCEFEETALQSSVQPIIGGTADDVDKAAVLVVYYDPTANKINYACSGTVVSPHVVLTAAHCIDPRVVGNGPSGNPFTFLVFIGNDAHSSEGASRANFLDAKAAYVHPQFVPNPSLTDPAWYDVGAIVTKTALPAAPLAYNRWPQLAAVGTAIQVIGFGVTSDSSSSLSGRRYSYAAQIQAAENDRFSFQSATSSLCAGDSGGPSLAAVGDQLVIVGVHKGGLASGSCLGAIDFDSRIDLYTEFIDPIVASADPGFVPPSVAPPAVDAGVEPTPDAGPTSSGQSSGQSSDQSSGCSAAPSAPRSPGVLVLLLAALGLAGARRRARAG